MSDTTCLVSQINHFSFTVSDLRKSVDFFHFTFGLPILDRSSRPSSFSEAVTGIAGAELEIAYLRASNCSLELIQYLSPKGEKIDTRTCNVGSAHICFNVDEFDKVIDRALTHGGRLAGKVCQIPGGPNLGRKVAYLEDLDGNTVEIISNKRYDNE